MLRFQPARARGRAHQQQCGHHRRRERTGTIKTSIHQEGRPSRPSDSLTGFPTCGLAGDEAARRRSLRLPRRDAHRWGSDARLPSWHGGCRESCCRRRRRLSARGLTGSGGRSCLCVARRGRRPARACIRGGRACAGLPARGSSRQRPGTRAACHRPGLPAVHEARGRPVGARGGARRGGTQDHGAERRPRASHHDARPGRRLSSLRSISFPSEIRTVGSRAFARQRLGSAREG